MFQHYTLTYESVCNVSLKQLLFSWWARDKLQLSVSYYFSLNFVSTKNKMAEKSFQSPQLPLLFFLTKNFNKYYNQENTGGLHSAATYVTLSPLWIINADRTHRLLDPQLFLCPGFWSGVGAECMSFPDRRCVLFSSKLWTTLRKKCLLMLLFIASFFAVLL